VEFREHWAGIFKAHPWLRGPEDSYLGYWERGGGASGEHSHAMNLWQHFASLAEGGRVSEVEATLRYCSEGRARYDDVCFLNLRTEKGLVGRVVQDVVTRPASKRARIQGSHALLEWVNDYSPDGDAIIRQFPGQPEQQQMFLKKRPDDFYEEVKHLEFHLKNPSIPSPIRLERGLDTMLVIAAAHLSEQTKRRIRIDYSKGYRPEALLSLEAAGPALAVAYQPQR
jgi:predicted dehydrogenase